MAVLLGTAGCGGDGAPPQRLADGEAAGTSVGAVTVTERWISPRDTAWNVDTPALWTDGVEGRVLTTAKATHDLQVYDAATGARLGPLGGEGEGPGRFRRPNAVLVAGDLAFVVERDNHRVQVLRMPGGDPAGSFGADVLERPYGAVLDGALPELTFWVTDDYEVASRATPDYSRRLHRFRVRFGPDGAPTVSEHAAYGDREGPGALRVVESLGLDPAAGRVLVADEERKRFVVYDTTGAFVPGPALGAGRIQGDPEGIALVPCAGADPDGVWIVTDQQDAVSLFRIFARDDFSYLGSFRGRETANTDGVTFARAPVPGFDGAAFFAVHDDQAVSAFDWGEVRAALGLPEACG